MKKFRILMGALALAMVAATVVSCKKNLEQSNNAKCKSCTETYYDISSAQQESVRKYADSINLSTAKDFSLEFLGVTDIDDSELDVSVILAYSLTNDTLLYCFFYDNSTSVVVNYAIASNARNSACFSMSFDVNKTHVADLTYNGITNQIVSDYENDTIIITQPGQGGRVGECYRYAKMACQQDPDCSTICDFIGWPICNLQMWLACLLSKLDPSAVVQSR